MICSLADLNDAVNSVVNHITKQVCNETTDGEFRIDLDDIDLSDVTPYMSWEDLLEYKDFVFSELAGRPELEDLDFTDQGFTGTCKREFCPNLADRTPNESLYEVRKTLSMTELAYIGAKAMEKTTGLDDKIREATSRANEQHKETMVQPSKDLEH